VTWAGPTIPAEVADLLEVAMVSSTLPPEDNLGTGELDKPALSIVGVAAVVVGLLLVCAGAAAGYVLVWRPRDAGKVVQVGTVHPYSDVESMGASGITQKELQTSRISVSEAPTPSSTVQRMYTTVDLSASGTSWRMPASGTGNLSRSLTLAGGTKADVDPLRHSFVASEATLPGGQDSKIADEFFARPRAPLDASFTSVSGLELLDVSPMYPDSLRNLFEGKSFVTALESVEEAVRKWFKEQADVLSATDKKRAQRKLLARWHPDNASQQNVELYKTVFQLVQSQAVEVFGIGDSRRGSGR